MTESQPFLLRVQQIEASLQTFSHPWNPQSRVTSWRSPRLLWPIIFVIPVIRSWFI